MARKQLISDDERLAKLEVSFNKLAVQARLTGRVRGLATMAKICEDAGIEKVYVYGKKTNDPDALKKYAEFRERHRQFVDSFLEQKDGSMTIVEAATRERDDAFKKNKDLLEQVHHLEKKTLSLNERIKKLSDENLHLAAIAHTPSSQQSVAGLHGTKIINTISPDHALLHNNEYEFNDPQRREAAWNDSRTAFKKLIRRNLPQRVYLLVGCPGAGKTTWAEQKAVALDRHAIIIDACNLTREERNAWAVLAAKGRDVRLCVVRFLADFETLKKRNARRPEGRRLDLRILRKKFEDLQEIDPLSEFWVDELIYLRGGEDE